MSKEQVTAASGPKAAINGSTLGKCAKCGYEFRSAAEYRFTGKNDKICRGQRDCRRRQ